VTPRGYLFQPLLINFAKSLLSPEQSHAELSIGDVHRAANVIFIPFFEVKGAENAGVAIGKASEGGSNQVAQLEGFGLRLRLGHVFGRVGLRQAIAPEAPPVFENDVIAHAAEKGSDAGGIVDLAVAQSSDYAGKGFLDHVVDIRTEAPEVIADLIPESEAVLLESLGIELHAKSTRYRVTIILSVQ
jgi:hypothetical protein